MELINKIDKLVGKLAPVAFILITFLYVLFRVPFFDEAHAYIISQFPLNEIFQLTRIEGHSALWFLILKVVTIKNSFYPYSMLFFNWICSSVLVLFIWKYFPFNNFIKFLLTFNSIMLNYYSAVARPYTLGVLTLFIIVYMYKTKMCYKKPIIFSLLMVFCGYLSVLLALGVLGIFALFIYDIFKEKTYNLFKNPKKDIILIFSVSFLGLILLFLQLYNPDIPQMKQNWEIWGFYLSVIHLLFKPFLIHQDSNYLQILFNFICQISLYVCFFTFLIKTKKAAIYLIFTFISLTLFFLKVYTGGIWHYYLYFIFLLIAYILEFDKLKNQKLMNFLLTLILIFLLCPYSLFLRGYDETTYTKNYKKLLSKIEEINDKDVKLYTPDTFSPLGMGLVPYFVNKNIDVYDLKGYKLNSFEHNKNIFNFDLDEDLFLKSLDKNKKNILITTDRHALKNVGKTYYIAHMDETNSGFYLDKIYENKDLCFEIYEIKPVLYKM